MASVKQLALVLVGLTISGCGPGTLDNHPRVSSSLALTHDDAQLWVVNPESDSVSLIDTVSRSLIDEVALGPAPLWDGSRYDPAIRPRALALSPDERTLWVVGQSSGRLYALDTQSRSVSWSLAVGSEPTAVIAAPDGRTLYVVAHRSGSVVVVDAGARSISATIDVGDEPFAASLAGERLWVTRFMRGAGVVAIDTRSLKVLSELALDDEAPALSDKRAPSGVVRGVYAAVPRPRGEATPDELWLPHLLLAIRTPQPELDFESTVFPTISRVGAQELAPRARLLFQPLAPAGLHGAFTDSVSGPRAIAFTPDGARALLLLAASEDVMVFDAERGVETSLVRPIPGSLLEGIVVDSKGQFAYLDGRGSHNVVALSLAGTPRVDRAPIERLKSDPMPDGLRLGQRLFYSANSAAVPVTKNFWVSCASCHLEGGSDAVTWKFAQGPRDTPANFGGTSHTGFLFRQALRNSVVQYDKTINVEQGGSFHRDDPTQLPSLQALALFVDQAIPLPRNPNVATDGSISAGAERGRALFAQRCASCHSGDWYTDSGAGNPGLSAQGPIVLHNVGTCVLGGAFPDKPAVDEMSGATHTACDFDTPTLRGVFATGPWLHDGSAATLSEAVQRMPGGDTLNNGELADLVAYVMTL